MAFTSEELWAERTRLSDLQVSLMNEGKTDEARVAEGQIKQLDMTLTQVLADEAELRRTAKIATQTPTASFGESILGPRNEFAGLEFGFKNEASDPTVLYVPGPTEIELTIPGKPKDLLRGNFASTLQSIPAQGSVSFKQRSVQYGEADDWDGVKDGKSAVKSQIIYTWKQAVANQDTVTGYVPISKPSLKDYDELLSVIENDLLIDLSEKENRKYLNGNKSTGIVGILNTPGITIFEPEGVDLVASIGGVYYESIRLMFTQVMEVSRRIPTHVCINPHIKTAIDLYKTSTGLYQVLGGDVLWGMKVVEDFDCDGILVYSPICATKRPIHNITVELGYINDQFVKNELSILAEKTTALQVRIPDAFCYASKTDLDAIDAGK